MFVQFTSYAKVDICLFKKYTEQKKIYPKELLYELPPRNGYTWTQVKGSFSQLFWKVTV